MARSFRLLQARRKRYRPEACCRNDESARLMIDGQRPKKLSGPKLWSPNEVSVVYYEPERSGRFCNQMMFMNDRFIRSFCVVWLIVAGVLVAGNSGLAAPVGDLDETHPAVRAVISVQHEVTPALLRQPEILGT